jgi:hypothetical protein
MAIGVTTSAVAAAVVVALKAGALAHAAANAIDASRDNWKGRCTTIDLLDIFSPTLGIGLFGEYYFQMLRGNNIADYYQRPIIYANKMEIYCLDANYSRQICGFEINNFPAPATWIGVAGTISPVSVFILYMSS